MSYNPNIITAASHDSFSSSLNVYPVFQGNTVTLELETPFDINSETDIVVERFNQTPNSPKATGIPHLYRDTSTGKTYVRYLVKEEETCVAGEVIYSFHFKQYEPEQHTKTLQVSLHIFPLRPTKTMTLMKYTRMLLSDDPVSSRRQVWSDMELYNFLQIALSEVNMTPTITWFDLDHSPVIWDFALAIGAEYHALRSLYNIESRDRFSFNDDGISFDINTRAEGFMQMINHIYSSYSVARQEMKKAWRPRASAFTSAFETTVIGNLRPFVVANLRGFNY